MSSLAKSQFRNTLSQKEKIVDSWFNFDDALTIEIFPGCSAPGSVLRINTAIHETQVLSVGQEDTLEKEWQPTLVFLPGKSLLDRGAWQAIVHGVARIRQDLVTKQQQLK